MDFNSFLEGNDQFGCFQGCLLFLLSCAAIFSSWQCYLHAFLGFIPPHRCWIKGLDNENSHYTEFWVNQTLPGHLSDHGEWTPDKCNEYSEEGCRQIRKCDQWKYDNTTFYSVPAEWQLFCDKEWWISLAGAVNMAGGLVGTPLMGLASDRYGRKNVLLICISLVSLSGTGAALANNIFTFMAFRFFVEMGESSMHYVVFVLLIEISGSRRRVKAATMVTILYSVGVMSLSGMVQLVRNWRLLQLITSTPAALLIPIYFWLLPESPRWLLATNQIKEAERVIQKIKRWNCKFKKSITIHEQQQQTCRCYQAIIGPGTDVTSLPENGHLFGKIRTLFRTKPLAMRVVVVALNRFLNGVIFMGLTMNATDLQENGSVSTFFLSGAVEIPAYLLCVVILDRFGRRISLIVAFFATAISSTAVILNTLVSTDPSLMMTLVYITKLCSSFINGVMLIYVAELFPTELRSTGVGLTSFVSTLSSIVAPFLQLAAGQNPSFPHLAYSFCALIGGLMTFYLPETRNTKLADTLEDTKLELRSSGDVDPMTIPRHN